MVESYISIARNIYRMSKEAINTKEELGLETPVRNDYDTLIDKGQEIGIVPEGINRTVLKDNLMFVGKEAFLKNVSFIDEQVRERERREAELN